MTDIKKVRTPRNLESIKAGALKLELAERISLVETLKISIQNEVKSLQDKAADATKLANGTGA